MINDIVLMNGYGLYVWSAFSFTLISFAVLYRIIQINLVKEKNKFTSKFGLLDQAKAKVAQVQSTNKKILASRAS